MNTSTGTIDNVPDYHSCHHRHIRHAGLSIWPLLAILAIVAPFWLYHRVLRCMSDQAQFCESSFLVPLSIIALVIGAFLYILWELGAYGRHMEQARAIDVVPGNAATRIVFHCRHAYRRLEPSHKRHVKRAIGGSATVVGVVAAYWLFYLDISGPIALSIVAGLALASAVVNRYWL